MLEVLVEPHGRRIRDRLRGGEQTVGDLVSELGLSQPGVSKHLRVLRRAGLVEVRADGQRRRYRLRTEPLREIDEWLAPSRAARNRRLGPPGAPLGGQGGGGESPLRQTGPCTPSPQGRP